MISGWIVLRWIKGVRHPVGVEARRWDFGLALKLGGHHRVERPELIHTELVWVVVGSAHIGMVGLLEGVPSAPLVVSIESPPCPVAATVVSIIGHGQL